MRRIRDQNYRPVCHFSNSIHSMTLVVTLKRGQILLRAPPECRKTVAQPVEASLQRIMEARLDDVRETAGAPGHP